MKSPTAGRRKGAQALLQDAREVLSINVLARRTELQLSQADLAKRADIARPVISKIETGNGDFQISALGKLAAALRCDVAELFRERPQPTIQAIQARATTPREEFIDGETVWAAVDEIAAAGMARRVSSGRGRRPARTRTK